MALYECVILMRQEISAQQVDALIEEMSGVITQGGGSVLKKENWGLRTLAYRVKKNRKAHYVLLNLDTPSAAVKEMERQMGINEDVLRHLTLRVEALDPEPSVVLQFKGEREGRDGRDGGRDGRPPRRDDRPRDDRPREDRPRRSEGAEF